MKVQDKVAEIAKLCVEVTMNTEHDVFFEYMAHVQSIEARIYLGGWKDFGPKDASLETYLDGENSEQNLNLIVEQLQDLLK